MTVDEYVAKSGRAVRRAVEMELHLSSLADLAAQNGNVGAEKVLRLMASRAMPVAEKFITSLRGLSAER